MTTNTLLRRLAISSLCLIAMLPGGRTASSQTTTEISLPLSTPQSKSRQIAPGKPKQPTAVQFCLLRSEHTRGVTHPAGVQLSEAGPLEFFVEKPVFTLTPEHVKTCELKETPPPLQNSLDYFTLHIDFSDRGRAAMFAALKELQPVSFVMVVNKRAFPVRISFDAQSVGETSRQLRLGYFVDRQFGQSIVDALSPSTAPSSQERSQRLYFPTVVGTRRVIQSTRGEESINEFTETVASIDEIDGELIVTLNRENSGNKDQNESLQVHKYAVSSKGLSSLPNGDDGVASTPVPLLRLPAKVAKMWSHEHSHAEQGMTQTSDFTVWAEEAVEVPAGKFRAIPIHHRLVWKHNGIQVRKRSSITWYAIGVGVVKRVTDSDGTQVVTQLKEFTRGNAK